MAGGIMREATLYSIFVQIRPTVDLDDRAEYARRGS